MDLGGLWLGEQREGWRGEGANYVKGTGFCLQQRITVIRPLRTCAARSIGVCGREFWAEDPAWAKAQRPEYRI